MMPPIVPSQGDTTSMMMLDHEPVASEAEGDDLIDVVGVHHGLSASAPFRHTSPVVQPLVSSVSGALSGKKYHCQRCLNHGLEIPRKGHKRECQYADCECDDCKLVEKRKILNREINSERERVNGSPITPPAVIVLVDRDAGMEGYTKVRNPRCARCRAHDPDKEPPPLKGHKKACRYKNCDCKKCSLITCRRDVMAKQIRLRRKQKSKITPDTGSSPSSAQSPGQVQIAAKQQQQRHQKVCVDLVTPPATENGTRVTPEQMTNHMVTSTTTTGPAAPTVRPQPTYPLALAAQQQSQPPPSLDQYSATNSPITALNPFTGQTQFQTHPFAAQQLPQPAPAAAAMFRDLATTAALCPQQLFAGFIQYVHAIANAAAAGAQPAGNNQGLTLPTMPAATTTMDHSGRGPAPTAIAVALAAAAAARHHPPPPPRPADLCIPFCLSSTGSNLPQQQHFHHAMAAAAAAATIAHQQPCVPLNDHQRLAALASAFIGGGVGGQGPVAQAPPLPPPSHFFQLQ